MQARPGGLLVTTSSRTSPQVIETLKQENRSALIAQSELTHSVSLLDREYVIERGEIVDSAQAAAPAGG